jgi:hypothetical protein
VRGASASGCPFFANGTIPPLTYRALPSARAPVAQWHRAAVHEVASVWSAWVDRLTPAIGSGNQAFLNRSRSTQSSRSRSATR